MEVNRALGGSSCVLPHPLVQGKTTGFITNKRKLLKSIHEIRASSAPLCCIAVIF